MFITKKFAAFLANIVLTIIYFVIIVPISLVIKITYKDSLWGHEIKPKSNSFWVKKVAIKQDMKWAQEQ